MRAEGYDSRSSSSPPLRRHILFRATSHSRFHLFLGPPRPSARRTDNAGDARIKKKRAYQPPNKRRMEIKFRPYSEGNSSSLPGEPILSSRRVQSNPFPRRIRSAPGPGVRAAVSQY